MFVLTQSGNLATDPKDFATPSISGVSFTLCGNIMVVGEQTTEQMWVDVSCQGLQAMQARKLKKRDGVKVRGWIKVKYYTTGTGEGRKAYQMDCTDITTHNDVFNAKEA